MLSYHVPPHHLIMRWWGGTCVVTTTQHTHEPPTTSFEVVGGSCVDPPVGHPFWVANRWVYACTLCCIVAIQLPRGSIPIVPQIRMVPGEIQCSLRYGCRGACAHAAARVLVRAETNSVAVLGLALLTAMAPLCIAVLGIDSKVMSIQPMLITLEWVWDQCQT